jgi:ATP-dependent protease ClpP protease subunit
MNFNNKRVGTGEVEEITNRGASSEDLMFDFPFGKKSVKHFRQIIPVQIHHFYIIDEIREVDPYVNLINTLKTSEQHDTIFIYLNTPGGNLLTTLQIISAIKQSAATVVTCMEGQVASAGTMIFLAGHRHIVGPNTIFMAHNYSGFVGGKGFELKTRQKFDEQYFHKFVRATYTGFLSEEEITSIMEDRDVWLDAEEVAKRLKDKLIPMPSAQQDETQNFLATLLGEMSNNGTLMAIPLGQGTAPTDVAKPVEPKKPRKTRAKPAKPTKVDKPLAK